MTIDHRHQRPPIPRRLASFTAAATAVVLLVPAAAGAWPQAGGDSQATNQAVSAGPSDPGLGWLSDLSEFSAPDNAPEGFGFGGGLKVETPIIGADGTIMIKANATGQNVGQGNQHLLGVDPSDGSLAWNRPFQLSACVPGIDSQGRTWTLETDGEGFAADDTDVLVAIDSATGEAIPDTQLAPVSHTEADDLHWCRSTTLHIGGVGDLERAILFDGRPLLNSTDTRHGILAIDVSGSTPNEAWVLDPEDGDAPFGEVIRDLTEERIGAFTDDSLLVTTRTAGVMELVELSLADGAVTNRVALPAYDEEGDEANDSHDVTSTTVLVDGATAVVSATTNSNGRGALHAVDLNGDWTQPEWSQPFVDNPSGQRGPRKLALSGDNVISASGAAVDNLYGLDTSTGVATAWSGDLTRVREGRGGGGQYVTDVDDTIFVNDFLDGSSFRLDRAVTAFSPDGVLQWRFSRADLLEATGLSDGADGLNNGFRLVAIGDDGVLYLASGDQLIAVDDSGGLADTPPRFDDVPADSTHSESISRLVDLGITSGTSDTTYGPTNPVTRQQFATFLVRALGEDHFPSETFDEDASQFDDVDASNPHAANISAVAAAGITSGVTPTTFAPTAPLPRAQMASLLVGAFDLDDGEQAFPSDTFDDVPPNSTHAHNIEVVAALEITSGTTPTTFAPERTVDRAQMATFLVRTLDVLDDEG